MHVATIETNSAAPAGADLTIDRAALLPALALLAKRIVESRNTIPILSNVLIEPAGIDQARLTATNLDIAATVVVPCTWHTPAPFTVHAETLHDLAKKADKGARIAIRCADGHATVCHGRSKQRLPMLPADDFPAFAPPLMEKGRRFMLGAEWARDLAALVPAISKEKSRYYLNGVALDQSAGRLCMVATDGYTVAAIDRPCPAGAEGLPVSIIHRETVAALLAVAKDNKGAPLLVEMSGTRARFSVGNVELVAKLIDGTFPDWRRFVQGQEDAPEPVALPELDNRLCRPVIDALAKAAGVSFTVETTGTVAVLTSPAYPEYLGISCFLKEGAALGSPEVMARINGKLAPVGGKSGVALTKEQIAAMCDVDYLFQTIAVAMPDGSTVHVLQWIMDAGHSKMWTVREDGRCFDEAERYKRQTLTREYVIAMAREPYAPVCVAEDFESPEETFEREYRKAWEARDGNAMRATVVKAKAAGCGSVVMAIAARVRGIDGERVRRVWHVLRTGSLAYHLRKQASYSRDVSAKRDWLAAKHFHPADFRWFVPVSYSGGKAYVRASELRDLECFAPELVNKKGQQIGRYAVRLAVTALTILPGKNAEERGRLAAAIQAWEAEHATPSAGIEPEQEAPAPVVAVSEPEISPQDAGADDLAPDTPQEPAPCFSGPENDWQADAMAQAQTDVDFSAWLTARFGAWMIAGRQSAKMTAQGKRAITPRQYAKLKAQWQRGDVSESNTVEPVEPAAPPSVEMCAPDPVAALVAQVAALTARIEALEGEKQVAGDSSPAKPESPDLQAETVETGGREKRTRTPAQVRLLMRYLAMRKERDRALFVARRDHKEAAGVEASLRECLSSEQRSNAYNYAYAMRLQADLRKTKAKRRRAVLKARDLQTRIYAEYRLVDRANDKRREAERLAVEAQEQAEILGKSLRDATERALKAETALAAIEARRNGWPPAIQPATVSVRFAA